MNRYSENRLNKFHMERSFKQLNIEMGCKKKNHFPFLLGAELSLLRLGPGEGDDVQGPGIKGNVVTLPRIKSLHLRM